MLAALALLPFAGPIVLERGTMLPSYGRYVAVEDTVLDSAEGETPQGGASQLIGGPNRPILIQFLDLDRAIGRRATVKKATLELVFTKGTPKLRTARRLLAPWTEGPIATVAGALRGDEMSARWAATYRLRRGGIDAIPWQAPGARGDAEAEPIPGATAAIQGDKVTISGLEGAVQKQLDRWYDNHGFALEFEDSNDFLSSSATEGRPRLILEVEDGPVAKGPDLSVILISRSPEYDRYEMGGTQSTADQDGVAVPLLDHVQNATSKKWPDEGEKLIYTATIKNQGDAPAQAFEAQWLDREAGLPIVQVDKALGPGESTTLTVELPYRGSHNDHRVQPVGLRLFPKGTDADRHNDFVEVQQSALAFSATVTARAAEAIVSQGWSVEDWLQARLRWWNDVVSRYSRFSFAPDGALERVRWQKIERAEAPAPDLKLDAQLVIDSLDDLPKQLAAGCGLVALTTEGLRTGAAAVDGTRIPPSEDRFPGVLGGGETRVDSLLAPSLPFPYDAFSDAVFDPVKLEAGAVLAATEVYALNRNLGRRRGYVGDYLYDAPGSVLLTLTDMSGTRRLANVEATFYAMRGGSFAGAAPYATLKTGEQGSVLLPKRPSGAPEGFYTATGHTLSANPFGRIDPAFANGAIAVKATVNGVTEVGVLKLWQAIDAGARVRRPLALMTMRLNVPTVPLSEENAALGKPAKSSMGTVAQATDGNTEALVAIGDWLEVDLGEDRSIGEVAVSTPGDADWAFDIVVYSSGESAEGARQYAREGDVRWSKRRSGGGLVYRMPPQTARYVRIVPRQGGADARVFEIAVRTAR